MYWRKKGDLPFWWHLEEVQLINAKDLGIEGADFNGRFSPNDPLPGNLVGERHGKELSANFGGHRSIS
jgi:hypothetical protein